MRVSRDDKSGLPRRVCLEVGRGLVPVAWHGIERSGLQGLASELRPGQSSQRERDGRSGGSAGRQTHPADWQAQPPAPVHGVRAAQRDGDRDNRLDLIQAAEWRERPVQQVSDHRVEGAAERAVIASQRHRGHNAHTRAEPAPLRHVPPGQPGEPDRGHGGGGEDCGRGTDHCPASGQPWRTAQVEVGGPGTCATQHRCSGQGPGSGRRLLDIGQEVERVATLQQQRYGPPCRGGKHRGTPLQAQHHALTRSGVGQNVRRRQHQHGKRADRIDSAHCRDGQAGKCGCSAGGVTALNGPYQRQHSPGRHQAGQRGCRSRADQDGEGRPEGKDCSGQEPGVLTADIQRPR